MPTTSRNKPARTEAQMFPLVENWLRSNLTQKEFSIQQGLSPHVLPYWINRYRQQAQPASISATTNQVAATEVAATVETAAAAAVPTKAPASFIRLDTPPSNTTPAITPPGIPSAIIPENTAMSVELPSGVLLRFPALIPIAYLQEVVSLCSR